jgi:hypothetical protein
MVDFTGLDAENSERAKARTLIDAVQAWLNGRLDEMAAADLYKLKQVSVKCERALRIMQGE